MEKSAVSARHARHASRAPVFLTAVCLLSLALAPTWLRTHGDRVAALAILAFFSKLCHQRPDRELFLLGAPTAVCIRCLGIYAGAALGGLLNIGRNTAIRWLGAALLLNITDVAAETIRLHGNLPPLRFLMGVLIGVSIGALITSRRHSGRIPAPPALGVFL